MKPHEPLELPSDPQLALRHLISVGTGRELYNKVEQRMDKLTPAQIIQILMEGLKHVDKRLTELDREKEAYLTKRFGAALRKLDADQPTNEQIIIAEFNGERQQVIIKDAVAYKWKHGITKEKFCAVTQVSAWRPCVFTDKPVQQSSPKNDVLAALERGRALKNGERV